MSYLILTRKRKERWYPYGIRLFKDKKDAVSSVQVGISTYPENIFSIVYVDDAALEEDAAGQSR